MDNRRFLLDRLRSGATDVVYTVINCKKGEDGTITVEEGREMAGHGFVAGYLIRVWFYDGRYAIYMDSEDGREGGEISFDEDAYDSAYDLDVSTVFDAFEKWKELPQVRTETKVRDDTVEIKYYLCSH